MNIFEVVKESLDQHNIMYIERNDLDKRYLTIPYKGIKDSTNHIHLCLKIDEDLKVVTFTFTETRSEGVDIDHLKSELLDLSSSLRFGNLSMRDRSSTIRFHINYQVNQGVFSFEKYSIYTLCCINVYEKLKERGLI